MVRQAFLQLGPGVGDGEVPVLQALVEVVVSLEQGASDTELSRADVSAKITVREREPYCFASLSNETPDGAWNPKLSAMRIDHWNPRDSPAPIIRT